VFFPNGIAVEISCELNNTIQCTTDMLSFKGYIHRFLASTTQLASKMHDTIMPVLKTSAAGAVSACNADGTCGFRWNTGGYDGNTGAGQEMNALGALLSLMVDYETVAAPVTNSTGGTSVGNPNAGGDPNVEVVLAPVTGADRAGAGILTTLVLVAFVGTLSWMASRMNEGPKWVDEAARRTVSRGY
jgi:mannan endo-1,6-alpha-mannosidase